MSARKDTIVALATPPGRSGVALIKISGPRAFSLFRKLTRRSKEEKIFSHQVQFTKIFDQQKKKIDEVLIWAMKGPKTSTGEDMVEISTHGTPVVVRRTLEAALHLGARIAERGEFTKRAFLSGKVDLAQAEAIAQLISANSSEAAETALLHLEGALSREIKALRQKLLELLARLEASLDYPDEIQALSNNKINSIIVSAQKKIEKLASSHKQGALLKDGLKVVIAGAPNVGKSSLLNCLAGDAKAIVTEFPGTTRDAIEELLVLEGLPLRIIDTAGLRHDPDHIERIGIEKTLAHVETADLVLFVVDATRKLSAQEKEKTSELKNKNISMIIINNKIDLLKNKKKSSTKKNEAFISAKTGAGIKSLEKKILLKAGWAWQKESSSPLILEARHKEKLLDAAAALSRVQQAVNAGREQDLLTIDLKGAIVALGEITGEEVSEEVINHIFENFCVGK